MQHSLINNCYIAYLSLHTRETAIFLLPV